MERVKRYYVFALPLAPALIGYIGNILLIWFIKIPRIPVLSTLLFYALPISVLVFWFWGGMKYSRTKLPAIAAVLIGNSIGIISFLIFIWQYFLVPEENRNFTLMAWSQHYWSLPGIVVGRIYGRIYGIITRPISLFPYLRDLHSGETVTITVTAEETFIIFGRLAAVTLLTMIAVFISGYLFGKRRSVKATE